MPAWITNHALSTGAIKLEDTQFEITGSYIYYSWDGWSRSALIGKDAFLSEDEAIKDVQKRKNSEYLKLQRKREKLDKLDPVKAVRDAKLPL